MTSDQLQVARDAGRARAQRGMTLVELLAAMSISLVISAMIIMSWVALSGSYANTVRRGKATDFARLAMDRMQREIRDAEQPPDGVAETAIVRARPFYIVLYTTFNKTDSAAPTSPPRRVMYRLYRISGMGELWRFQDVDGNGEIENVALSLSAPLAAREAGEGGQMLAKNVVNLSTPSTSNPTALFTYIYYGTDGSLVTDDHEVLGVDARAQIRAVEINLLIDMNPGKSPVYWHVRSTAQLRNTR
jgi:prepilin-type N-terminal cleavage/methylation domain-containing protein